MRFRQRFSRLPVLCTLALLSAALLTGAGRKPPAFSLRVHAETTPQDGELFSIPVTVGDPPVQVHVEKMPMVSERDVVAYYPIPAQTAGFTGAYFQLNSHGTRSLEALTTAHRGRFLVLFFNGRAVARLLITHPVKDGIVLVPDGIRPEELLQVGQALPQLGESDAATTQRQRQEAAQIRGR